ncbi:NTP pyrophosphohydrolase superfamily protein [Escherichia phage vB_Eco_AL25]|nr:gp36 [Escherichia phage vB_Eco_Jura]CAH6421928.1 NTP pyrophosphohydrolase superfamily protein [Escherichia phage vB_Eco_AL25]
MNDSSKDTLVQTQNWFLKAVPNPTSKNISTQIGCHLEEVAEMLEAICSVYKEDDKKIAYLREAIVHVADLIKQNGGIAVKDPNDLLDSIADQIVTATGVGTFLGMNVPGALTEVNRSNYSKFEDGEPVFDENKKVMKGKDYTPPDLTPFI